MSQMSERRKAIYNLESADESRLVPPMPRNMMLELTNACNHACVFCTNPHMRRKPGRMDFDFTVRLLKEAHAEGVEEVGFYTTGEPFIHKDLEAFTRIAAETGFEYIYISTNGALATPDRTKAVIDAGLTSMKFSINAGNRDSYRTIHGRDDWDRVMANLAFVSDYRKTLNRRLNLFVTFIATTLTEGEVAGFKEAIGPLVDEISVTPCQTQGGQMTAANALVTPGFRPKDADAVCSLPFKRLHISHEGYVSLCCVDYHNYLAVADLNKMSLGEAWRSHAFQEARRRHLDGRLEGTLCGNCWLDRSDPIVPLDESLATPIDLDEQSATARAATARRMREGGQA